MRQKTVLQLLRKEKLLLIKTISKGLFWFLVGGVLGLFFLLGFAFIFFQQKYANVVYPGIMVNNIDFSGKTQNFVKEFFARKNDAIGDTTFVFQYDTITTNIKAEEIHYGYNGELLAKQAYSLGRSPDFLSNLSLILQAYIHGINLEPSYQFYEDELGNRLAQITKKAYIVPVDALFNFKDGKVSAFRPSSEGQEVNLEEIKNDLRSKIVPVVVAGRPQTIFSLVPVRILKPKVSTDQANNLGIKELVASGTSLFQHSIPGRVFNITLAATRLNGILVAPNEVFSFNKSLGDVSAFTGYKQAYIIQNGKTVLGDGGGVCQVSTTLFRAVLSAGLPIIERYAHAYRVGYYEQDSPPGIDATVYEPSVDFKFKNDTNSYILVQTVIDPSVERLTFMLYGTKDGREIVLSKPVITSQTPPPPPQYLDDPALPKGVEKQVDFEAVGANVYFTRQVSKNGEIVISDKFTSNFQPWRAVYLRGTKE